MTLILTILGAALVGAITALKVIAPMTKTTADDKVLARLEQLEGVVGPLIAASATAKVVK